MSNNHSLFSKEEVIGISIALIIFCTFLYFLPERIMKVTVIDEDNQRTEYYSEYSTISTSYGGEVTLQLLSGEKIAIPSSYSVIIEDEPEYKQLTEL